MPHPSHKTASSQEPVKFVPGMGISVHIDFTQTEFEWMFTDDLNKIQGEEILNKGFAMVREYVHAEFKKVMREVGKA